MKKITLLLFCVVLFSNIQAQLIAVTETGDEVLLYNDGTWKFKNEEENVKKEIPTNPNPFTKDKKSSFLLKSNKINLGFWLNPKEWSFKKATSNMDAEYELQLKEGDLYAMIITEKIVIPLESLKNIALETGRGAAPDLRVVKEEYRTVNGMKILLLQLDGTMSGIKFSYYGYYYSSDKGIVQFVTYTSQNLLDTFRDKCDNLLNGLVELD